MNKLLIVLLAICLVAVHGFVKRDAPAAASPPENDLTKLTQQFQEFMNKVGSEFQKNVNPDAIKNQLQSLSDTINEGLKNFQTPTTNANKS